LFSVAGLEHGSDLPLVHLPDWEPHSHESRCKRNEHHDTNQCPWDEDVERKLEEHVELSSDNGSCDATDKDTEQGSTEHNDHGLVQEDASSFILRDSHRPQDSVLPDSLSDVLIGCDEEEEECDGQSDRSN